MDDMPHEAWARICRRLRAEFGEDVFTSWFGRLELDRLAEPVAYLSVPDEISEELNSISLYRPPRGRDQHRIQRDQANHHRCALVLASRRRPLRPCIRLSAFGSARRIAGPRRRAPRPARPIRACRCLCGRSRIDRIRRTATSSKDIESLGGSPLDKRLNFNNFLVGRSNQLAHAAAPTRRHRGRRRAAAL